MADGVKISALPLATGKKLSDSVPFSGSDPFDSYRWTLNELTNSGRTGLTGGGSTNLDGVVSATEDLTQTWLLGIGGVLYPYQLVNGTDAQDLPYIVRPLDFDNANNPKVFKLLTTYGSPNTSGLTPPGIFVATAANTFALRTITGTSNQVTVANGDGLSGNPTLSLPTAVVGVNSFTAAVATDLTLAGGSSGASLVLGQGANGGVTLTPKGTGAVAVGVTPNQWNTIVPLEIGGSGSAVSGNVNGLFLSSVAYYNSGWKYAQNSKVASKLEMATTGLNFSVAAPGTAGNAITWLDKFNIDTSGNTTISATTASTSSASGALQVAGGAGIAGALNIGSLSLAATPLTVQATGSNAFILLDANQAFYLASNTTSPATAGSTTKDSVSLYLRGSYWNGSAAQNLDAYIDNNVTSTAPANRMRFVVNSVPRMYLNSDGQLSVTATTASSSPTIGALVVGGGAGVADNVVIGNGKKYGIGGTDMYWTANSGTGVMTIDNYSSGSGFSFQIRQNGATPFAINTANNVTFSNSVYVDGSIYEKQGSTYYNVVTQYDIGTAANQVPLNQYLGGMAYQDPANVTISGGTLSGVSTMFSDGTSGAPSITFQNETNVGFYRAASAVVGLSGSLKSSGFIQTGSAVYFVPTENVQIYKDTTNNRAHINVYDASVDQGFRVTRLTQGYGAYALLDITGDGNLTVPGTLAVNGANAEGTVAKFWRGGGGSEKPFYINQTNNQYVNLATEGDFKFKTGVTANQPYSTGTTALLLTSTGAATFAGNLAIRGATFPAWAGTPILLQFGDDSIYANPSAGGTLRMLSNLYYSESGWKRRSAGYGTLLSLENASMEFRVAGYDSADTIATLTTALSIAQTTNVATFAGNITFNSGATSVPNAKGIIFGSATSIWDSGVGLAIGRNAAVNYGDGVTLAVERTTNTNPTSNIQNWNNAGSTAILASITATGGATFAGDIARTVASGGAAYFYGKATVLGTAADNAVVFFGQGDQNSATRAGMTAWQSFNGTYTDSLLKFSVLQGGVGGVDALTFAATGAATFASTITATGDIASRYSLSMFDGATADKWVNYTYTDKSLRWNYNGAGGDEMMMTNGGELLIGTSVAEGGSNKLKVGGAATFASTITVNGTGKSSFYNLNLIGDTTTLSNDTNVNIGWMSDSHALNPTGVNGALLLSSRTNAPAGISLATYNDVKLHITGAGRFQFGTPNLTMPVSDTYRAYFSSPGTAVGQPTIMLLGSAGGYGAGVEFASQLGDQTTTVKSMARIVADGDDSWTTTAATQDARLSFWTTGNGTLTERMRINSGGYVGIGTAAPAHNLHVVAADGTNPADYIANIQNSDTTSGQGNGLRVQAGNGSSDGSFIVVDRAGVNPFLFVRGDGNVGIWTTTPNSKLTVEGTSQVANFTGSNDTAAVYARFGTSGSTGQGFVGVEGSSAGTINTDTLAYATYIGSSSSGTALQLGTAGGVRMTLKSDGAVGIGTNTPRVKLEVRSGIGTMAHYVSSPDWAHGITNTTPTDVAHHYELNSGGQNLMRFFSSGSATAVPLVLYGIHGHTTPTVPAIAFNSSRRTGADQTNIADAQPAFAFDNWGTRLITVLGGGNVLIGTTTDNANGKLQVYNAGNVAGFTTTSDNSWVMKLILSGGNEMQFSPNVTGYGGPGIRTVTTGGAAYSPLTLDGSALYLKTGATTALTLDSSQNATFEGSVIIKGGVLNFGTGGANGYFAHGSSATNFYGPAAGGSTVAFRGGSNSSVMYLSGRSDTSALTLDASNNATLLGDLTVSGGNVGVGTVASTWSIPSIDMSSGGATFANGNSYGFAVNSHYNAGWYRKNTAAVAHVELDLTNGLSYRTESSGSAGSTIASWITRFSVNPNGSSTNSGASGVSHTIDFSGGISGGTEYSALKFTASAHAYTGGEIRVVNQNGGFNAGKMQFFVGGSEQASINYDGVARFEGGIFEKVGSTYYPVVTQYDIGTAANQVPLNQYLGSMAYQNADNVSVGSATFSGKATATNSGSANIGSMAFTGAGAYGGGINFFDSKYGAIYVYSNGTVMAFDINKDATDSLTSHAFTLSNTGATFAGGIGAPNLVLSPSSGTISSTNTSATELVWNLRGGSAKAASLVFTEESVADRWALGIKGGDGNLYFTPAEKVTAASAVATLSSGGSLTLSGGIASTASFGANNLRSNTEVNVAADAVRDIVAQNYGIFVISESAITGAVAIIAFNAGGTYIVWQEGTNFSTTADTASKFNVYYRTGNTLSIQNKKASQATFNVLNLGGKN